jgi:hypothetical protein
VKHELTKIDTLVKDTFELNPPINQDKNEGYQRLKSILEDYDIGNMVSNILHLEWKEKVLINDTDSKYGADYKLPKEAYVNYSHGAWGAIGITHEMVHLIMHQNTWIEIPKIKNYIKEHEDLQDSTRMRTVGYPIEQMIAYLLMKDVALKISENDDRINKERVLSQYNKDWFTKILDTEYPTEHLKLLGNKIIEGWKSKSENLPITNWIESILD